MPLLTLMSIIAFSSFCVSAKSVDPKMISDDSKIIRIDKKSGEIIQFNDDEPARVSGIHITGEGEMTRAVETLEIPTADIRERIFCRQEELYSEKTRDG